MTKRIKLYIPGPVEVSDKTFEAFRSPMIGHRGEAFKELYRAVHPGLQALFMTRRPVYLSTSSAWGVMEGVVRNLVHKKALNCMCGAFSDKWYDVTRRCGREADKLQVEWGQSIEPDALNAALSTGEYDVVTLVHNETSTGVLNPLADLAAVVRQHPGVLLVVDTVSSFSALPIPMDELGLDVMLTGSQKALALPPGLALFSASERAMERAAASHDRGYYFDLLEFRTNQEADMTPSTPSVSHVYALRSKLEDISTEGLQNRYARHRETNQMVHDWTLRHGFGFFAPENRRSVTLTCVKNTRNIDVPTMIKRLKERHGAIIDGGYGKIKGSTFRISNMGDETPQTIGWLLEALDDCLEGLG